MGLAVIIKDADFSALNLGQVTIEQLSTVVISLSSSGDNYAVFESNYPDETTWSIVSGSDVATLADSNGKVNLIGAGTFAIKATISDGSFKTKTYTVSESEGEEEMFVDNTNTTLSQYNRTDNQYMPVFLPISSLYSCKHITKFKGYFQDGTIALGIYSYVDGVATLVSSIGSFTVTSGVNTIDVDVKLGTNQTIGIISGNIYYAESAISGCLSGGYAQAAFTGTLAIGLGGYNSTYTLKS